MAADRASGITHCYRANKPFFLFFILRTVHALVSGTSHTRRKVRDDWQVIAEPATENLFPVSGLAAVELLGQ